MRWLVLSVVLTIVLNIAIRMFPSVGRSLGRAIFGAGQRRAAADSNRPVPWRSMIYASVALTVFVNLVLWIL